MVAWSRTALDGNVELDPEVAGRYLKEWHGLLGENVLVSVVMLPSARSFCAPLSEVVARLDGLGLEELVYPAELGAVRQSVYVAAGVLRERPVKGRGGKKYFEHAPGTWMDLDVREGGFSGWDEIVDLVVEMDRAGIGPQMMVGTGSGGAHLYWAVEGGIAAPEGEMLGRRLRLWVESRTDYAVDHCENSDRVLRLPGSIRWPKPAGGGHWDAVPRECTLVRERVEGSWAAPDRIRELTAEVWEEWSSRTREHRGRRATRRAEAMDTVWGVVDGEDPLLVSAGDRLRGDVLGEIRGWVNDGVGRGQSLTWREMWALSMAEDEFDESVGWAAILEPRGWRRYGEPDDEGRVQWTRPGGGEHSGRSLVTDWAGSPNVGSLLSMAEETGLRTMHDAGVPLTKHAVAAALYWNGNVGDLLRAWLCGGDWRRGVVG
jgi:hypothetical protein